MIFSENPKPEIQEFRQLMKKTDLYLNREAKGHEHYFQTRSAQLLEKDVCDALEKCAKGSCFENTIQLVSGAQFPDIVAGHFYGVEVKSTIKNHWTSTGSSILESTRIKDIERIFMTFGKLGNPVEFLSRPYEECLSEIAVTHYPRYKIDMTLKKGETIFDKMGISYDELRKLENPVAPVSKYYKSKLKKGERLWWSSDSETDFQEESSPAAIRFFSSLSQQEKENCVGQMMAYFPSIFGNEQNKYDAPSLWLLTEKSIFNTHLRDSFSAGGKKEMQTNYGETVLMPALFKKIEANKIVILDVLENASSMKLFDNWGVQPKQDRIVQWCKLCAHYHAQENKDEYKKAIGVLFKIFSVYQIQETNLCAADHD